MLSTEPVRLYAIAAAALALAAHYLGDLPVPLILGLVAAILGLGEGVRSKVTPDGHIEWVDDSEAHFYGFGPTYLEPTGGEDD